MTKVDSFRKMADDATQSLTAQIKDWSRFLVKAGQLYKYNFLDQVMIYTQRPDATACAGFDLWTRRMNRSVRRGSKGIALLRYRDGRIFLRYVFDIADTVRRENAHDPNPWIYRPEYEGAIMSRLEECFKVPGGDGLATQLIHLAVVFSEEHWHDFKDNIMSSVGSSFLDELDEDNVALRFQSAMTVSLSFLLLARCGMDLDSYFEPEDFGGIGDFNTWDMILALGNAINGNANVILRQIEYAIRKYERDKAAGNLLPAHPSADIPIPSSDKLAAEDPSPVRPPIEIQPEDGPAMDTQTTSDPPLADPTANDTAAGKEKPAAAPVLRPESDTPAGSEESGQICFLSLEQPPVPAHPSENHVAIAANFRIMDNNLGAGGPKAKYAMNVEAIRLLKRLEAERRSATAAEQEVLSHYVGWGGVPNAFEPDKPDWADEYAELKALLTEEEYVSARASVLNSHYTPPIVIRAIYEALGSMGFVSGNILEPSCGVGNFFGCLPEYMAASRLYGVELDSISGRIAQQLYPKARITVAGFETTDRRDFFDVAVDNVPFGDYPVHDPAYNKHNFSIHNYFLCKTLDQLRPGGIMAFVTSRFTMDSKDSSARKYLAERADLLGAIRLPNTAFKANAGTDVISDILFFQKLDEPNSALPDWVNTMENQDGYPVNSYFLDYPEMVLGCPGEESTRYGHDYTVFPTPGADLSQQLHEAVTRIRGTYRKAAVTELESDEAVGETIPADPGVKNFSYTIVEGAVYYRENSVMVKSRLNATAAARVKGMVQLRECVHELIGLQMKPDIADDRIRAQQATLNRLYDTFTARYGLINSRANRLAFDKDTSYYLLCSLEVLDDDGRLEGKADIFTKRTIKQRQPVTHVDTAQEALAVSIGERARVDLPYMTQLTGKAEETLIADLQGMIFKDPQKNEWQTADEYLSGNVRQKLREARRAAEEYPEFQANVDALIAAQPRDLEAGEIEVRLGATWIAPEYIQQFMYETFLTPMTSRDDIRVIYVKATAAWFITHKTWIPDRDVTARTTYGTDRRNAYEILEETLNLRDVRIYDTVDDADGKERRVLNVKATTLAAQKQQAIKDAFKDWLWQDPERRQTLVRHYNDTMNCIRPREYDGSNIVFHGINPEIKLRPHQLNAIAHVLYGGNTLLAHEVGAGKTFEMIAAVMESKYLGLCTKAVMVVPNHLTQQTAAEFLRLYPAANILVTTRRDFETAKRKKFCARIATGDWDAVIIGHSQFERIPMSYKRQKKIINDQISDITTAIDELKVSKGERFSIKQMEKLKANLKARLERLKADWKKDSTITFEQLGIDMMLVDESDMYKNRAKRCATSRC